MMIGNTEAPAGAATPFAGAGNNPYTDCITIPLEEYKKTLEMATELGIIRDLAGDRNIYRVLAKSQPDSMVPLTEYESLQNTTSERIAELKQELLQKDERIAHLEHQMEARPAGRICASCGRQFFEEPATSRHDPGKLICSVCGAAEALEDAKAAGVISKGEAKEVQKIIEDVAKEGDELIPRASTPEQCRRGGKKKPGMKANLPMEEICELKKQGWSNVRLAKKYGVTDVTIGSRLKQYWAEQELTVEKIRILRKEGWTYEKIEAKYGVPEDKIRQMLREAGRAERSAADED